MWKRWEKKNRKYRMGHVTYLCIWQTFVEILILFVQRMFCNGKKNYTYGNSLKSWGRPTKKFFSFLFFSVLIVIVHACLSREGDACHSFWNGKKKKKLLLFWQKRTYDSDPQHLKAYVDSVCYWDEWPLLCTAWLCWLLGPYPILSVALCTSSYLTI